MEEDELGLTRSRKVNVADYIDKRSSAPTLCTLRANCGMEARAASPEAGR